MNTCMIHDPAFLSLHLGIFLKVVLKSVCDDGCFLGRKLHREKCGVMIEALSYGPATWVVWFL